MNLIPLKIKIILLLLCFGNCVSYSNKNLNENSEVFYPHNSGNFFLNYINNRILDARDIFSLNLTYGFLIGAKLQVSKLGIGLYGQSGSGGHGLIFSEELGLRGGEIGYHTASDRTFLITSKERFSPENYESIRRASARKKELDEMKTNPQEWTRLGVTIGLIGGIKAEFNPGELLDFVLGIFLIDIYNDDVYKKSNK